MLLKKQSPETPRRGDSDVVSVIVEPLPNHSCEEVLDRLRALGATEVEVVAAGFISASVIRRRLSALEDIAHAGVKPRSLPI